jgi:hypothetical protein
MFMLRVGKTTMVRIELKQTDPLGRTVIMCREGLVFNNDGLEGCAKAGPLQFTKEVLSVTD